MNRIRIINRSGYPAPEYKTEGSAGCDLRAVLEHPKKLLPLERAFIPTGIYISLPEEYEAQVRGRSGLNRKHGLVVPVGTVDSDYRGEIGVVIYNLSREEYTIRPGDSIAQLVIAPVARFKFEEVEYLDSTERGEGGFGHTGR